MCDCYWKRCEVCNKTSFPLHIADFCMSRDDIKVYCKRHIPKKDVVIHKLVEDELYYAEEVFPKKRKRKWIEYTRGWKMAVRYLKIPPQEYGYTAATPNVGAEHIAKVITKSKRSSWTTEWVRRRHSSEVQAVKETIKNLTLTPTQQVWRRYLLRLEGRKSLKELIVSPKVLKEIRNISRRIRGRCKDLLGIIVIGSFAEGTYKRDSDIDIVFVKKRKAKYGDLHKFTKNTNRKIQLIPFRRKEFNEHFKNSTTMAYAIQRGKIVYQKRNFDYVSDCLPRAVVNFAILF